ncbi:MAG TPA: hypothetical protein VIH71_05420 [Solirubrobacteraceae bacterium]
MIIVVSDTFRDECLRAPSGLGKHPRAHHETIFRRPVDCRVVGPILRVADSKRGKMTMDVYAQLQQRAKRDHGAHFDELVRQARVQLCTPEETASNGLIGTAIGTGSQISPILAPDRAPGDDQKHASV